MNNNNEKIKSQYLSKSVKVDFFYIQPHSSESKTSSLEDIFTQIKNTPNFSLGEYSNEEKLKNDLGRKIFGESEQSFYINIFEHIETISKIVEVIIKKSFNAVSVTKNINVYILPLYNKEASEDLDGVNGFIVEGNIMYLLIDTTNEKWQVSLRETIPHEYAHLAYTSQYSWNSILDGMVNEGLAEHFREFIVGGNRAPWSTTLNKEDAIKELNIISEKDLNLFIDDSNIDFYLSYFFGTKNLQNWYGYSLGYWLIDEVISRSGNTLLELFKINPKQIFSFFRK
ncbi:MAG: DUF2268 domain-containing putative Zn-dependent protease [Candidatus Nomurabacteria bacterium]|nr:DUF2268 domain-containing putative Zn-dependent protease [Candidatus Nomurabacteria bacterium]